MGEAKEKPEHPGSYIKTKVLPAGLSVTEAADLLGVGRPALSNLLNENAALSPEMALRLEKTFGANQKKLLELQAEFEQFHIRSREQDIAVRSYVPSFLKITARKIEEWSDGNLQARSLLSVFLRKLVHSTGQKLSHVDFPGYDNAEKKGWDGQVEAGAPNPWVPAGKSGWEFGCNADPRKKADDDYAARVKAIPAQERAEITFVFVTPRNWSDKDKWIKGKEALRDWKSVRAYDASNLEQWLEQSLPAQGWVAEQVGLESEGVHSLDEQWHRWSSVTEPELSRTLFKPSIESHKKTLETWLKNDPAAPLIVCADSKAEALAFLSCIFEEDDFAAEGYRDKVVIFSSAVTLRKLIAASSSFVPIVFTEEVEQELGGVYRKLHTIVVRPKNTVETKPDIVLDLLKHEAFSKALEEMGIDDLRANTLGRESGYSPTILRRRLAKLPAIKTPPWTNDAAAVRSLIPMMLVGAWHAQSAADCEILALLAGTSYSEIDKRIADLLNFDDSPVWSVGRFRGVSSKIDAFFAVQQSVVPKDIGDFLTAAEIVLSEKDPALELPEDKRPFAALYDKSREFSGALREGLCETLVLLAVHGNYLFMERLGINIEGRINALIRGLLTPLTPETLLSQTGALPFYAEAAPDEFLKIIEEDLKTSEPQVYALMKPAGSGLFGGGCPRTGLLWALETLAWKPEQLLRVSIILAKLAERKIVDNWVNKPDNSLQAIFRSWMPQTAASIDQRKAALEALTKRFPTLGWRICLSQLATGTRFGEYSQRPRWRNDASGAGQPFETSQQSLDFARKSFDLMLAWPAHDENTLGDLIEILPALPEEEQGKVWDLIDAWIATAPDESRKDTLRERIRRFAFTRRSKHRNLTTKTKDRARETHALLTPQDVVIRHRWLFEKHWVEESNDELEDAALDLDKREKKIEALRIDALNEIWAGLGFTGIRALLLESEAPFIIGWHLVGGVISELKAAAFIAECLAEEESKQTPKWNEVIRGFLLKVDADVRRVISEELLAILPASKISRLFLCSPFQRDTWLRVDKQIPDIRTRYWSDINPNWISKDSGEINEVIDRLLEVKRPRAAFQIVHFGLEEVETSRLKRLLHEITTSDFEAAGTYKIDGHNISSALQILQNRPGVTRDEMARLEFKYLRALDYSEHGIPNLERQLGESPSLFMQVLAITYKRSDGGEDPPEWQVSDQGQLTSRVTACYAVLERIKRIPGTDENGAVNVDDLRAWVNEVRVQCLKYGRGKIGDYRIGQILSTPTVGADGTWPSEAIREVLEEIASPDITSGMVNGVSNSRGGHFRGEGGEQERVLAEKYRNWSRQLAFEYPYVSNLVGQIANQYDHEAKWQDSESAVRRRLAQ